MIPPALQCHWQQEKKNPIKNQQNLYATHKNLAAKIQGDLDLDLLPATAAIIPHQIENIVICDTVNNNRLILVFATEFALDFLSNCTEISIDGTFKVIFSIKSNDEYFSHFLELSFWLCPAL